MKKKLLKRKLLYLLLLSTLSLSGCNNNKNYENNVTEESNEDIYNKEITENNTDKYIPETDYIIIESATTENITTESYTTENITTEEYITTENITEENITTEEVPTNEVITTESTTEDKNNKNDNIVSSFNNDKEEIEYYLSDESIDIETVKQKGKAFFIKCVDFIFYDTEINGVKFDELTDEAKQDIYDTFCYIDSLIVGFAPDYKENISEKYQIVKDFTVNAYYYSLDKIKQAIGENNYNKISEIKENVKNTITDTAQDVKNKVKEYYEDFRSN